MPNDKKAEYRILDTHTEYEGWTTLLIATVRLPDGRTIRREIEDHGEAICVLPYHPARKTAILVRQPRIPVLYSANRPETLEAIAGIIEEADRVACVHREVMEEALLKLDSVEHIFSSWTMPGISDFELLDADHADATTHELTERCAPRGAEADDGDLRSGLGHSPCTASLAQSDDLLSYHSLRDAFCELRKEVAQLY